jgi:hypothetical protein
LGWAQLFPGIMKLAPGIHNFFLSLSQGSLGCNLLNQPAIYEQVIAIGDLVIASPGDDFCVSNNHDISISCIGLVERISYILPSLIRITEFFPQNVKNRVSSIYWADLTVFDKESMKQITLKNKEAEILNCLS